MAWGESKEWWLLLEFSEWLDINGYSAPPKEDDDKTHANLVDSFIEDSYAYENVVSKNKAGL